MLSRFHPDLRDHVGANLSSFAREAQPANGRRRAAVAVTLVADDDERPCFLITRRTATLPKHAGQWALPGGSLDPGETPERAALRELEEEVGLTVSPDTILGLLDDYPTRSGFVITPVVVWAESVGKLRPNPAEVAGVFRFPLQLLDRPAVPRLRTIPESDRPVLSIPLPDDEIFAPTAAVLYQLREVAFHGRETRVVHYDQPVFAWK